MKMSKETEAKILYNIPIKGSYFRIGLNTGWSKFNPGQFIMLKVPDNIVFLRRPFSICRPIDDGIEILYKVVGKGTERLRELKEREEVDIIGPLGNGFSVIPAPARGGAGIHIIMIAGGFGVAPFLALSKKVPGTLFYGGHSKNDILLVDEFEKSGTRCHISTEDGSLGYKGLVTELLLQVLSKDIKNKENILMLCCGPEGLNRAVQKIALKHKIKCQISYETYMACGIGVCLGCAVKTKDGFKRACKDGPVFDIEVLEVQEAIGSVGRRNEYNN